MARDQVQRDAGTIGGEALGETSHIMPQQAIQAITERIKSLPMAERSAYIARSTSPKNRAQMEVIRRTLENLGLLLPAGAAGASVAGRQYFGE